jgi:predicted nucleotidyltransferase
MLIPAGRKKILEVFMKEPFKEVHLREIARLSKVSLNNVDSCLRLFMKEGMFKRRKVSNMTFYRPNMENEHLLKLFEYLEIERRKAFFEVNKKISRLLKKYVQNLVDLSSRKVQMIILFGSVARGEWTKGSDIDILAVVSEKDEDLATVLNRAKVDVSPLLEIRVVTTTVNKFAVNFKEKTEFYGELWKDRIVLYNEFLFWQLIKEGE